MHLGVSWLTSLHRHYARRHLYCSTIYYYNYNQVTIPLALFQGPPSSAWAGLTQSDELRPDAALSHKIGAGLGATQLDGRGVVGNGSSQLLVKVAQRHLALPIKDAGLPLAVSIVPAHSAEG